MADIDSTSVGQTSPSLAQVGAILTDIGPNLAEPAHILPKPGSMWRTSTGTVPMPPKVGRNRDSFGRPNQVESAKVKAVSPKTWTDNMPRRFSEAGICANVFVVLRSSIVPCSSLYTHF